MQKQDMTIQALFDLTNTVSRKWLEAYTYPWEVLPHIGEIIEEIAKILPQDEYQRIGKNMYVHKSVKLPPTAAIKGPMLLCPDVEVRTGAFIRGNVIIGGGCVIGNSVEIKNAILFDHVQVPHYNYIGDSILGCRAHFGAGSLTSNVKSDKTLVKVHGADGDIETGLKKFGAMVGDGAEIGCNAVLNPGTIIGKRASVYPLSSVRGCVDADCIYKKQGDIVVRQ